MWYNPERNIKALTHSEIRSANPQVSMPASMTDANITEVGFYPFITIAPDCDPITQYVREIAPVLTQLGTYQQAYEVLSLDVETIAVNQARQIEQNNTRIRAELAALDLKRIRPTAEGDAAYLADLNAQAIALRGQLQ